MIKCTHCGFLVDDNSCANCHHPIRCEACKDVGWFHAFNTNTTKYEIQRCDSCAMIVSDEAAVRIHSATCEGCEWASLTYTSLPAKRQVRKHDKASKA